MTAPAVPCPPQDCANTQPECQEEMCEVLTTPNADWSLFDMYTRPTVCSARAKSKTLRIDKNSKIRPKHSLQNTLKPKESTSPHS